MHYVFTAQHVAGEWLVLYALHYGGHFTLGTALLCLCMNVGQKPECGSRIGQGMIRHKQSWSDGYEHKSRSQRI